MKWHTDSATGERNRAIWTPLTELAQDRKVAANEMNVCTIRVARILCRVCALDQGHSA